MATHPVNKKGDCTLNGTDKVSIIKVAASRIGHEIAKRFVPDGAHMAIVEPKLNVTQSAADAVTQVWSGTAMAVEMTVTDGAAGNDRGAEVVMALHGATDLC